jgi:hypothetical protein
MLSLILVITTLLVSGAIESKYLADYSNLYIILTLSTIIGMFIFSSVYGYEWKFAGIIKALIGTMITLIALFGVMTVYSAFATTPDVIGIPYIPEFTIPEEIPIEVELTPGQSIFRGYLNLATILGIPTNILISAVLMFPAGFSESLFQTALPRLFTSWFGESTAAEASSVAISNLIFGGLHFITYGFNSTVFLGTFIGGMTMSITYRYHESEIGLGMGHTLYDLMLLFVTQPIRRM